MTIGKRKLHTGNDKLIIGKGKLTIGKGKLNIGNLVQEKDLKFLPFLGISDVSINEQRVHL